MYLQLVYYQALHEYNQQPQIAYYYYIMMYRTYQYCTISLNVLPFISNY